MRICLFVAVLALLFTGAPSTANDTDFAIEPSSQVEVPRFFGWGNQEKSEELQGIYAKLRVIDNNFKKAEDKHALIFNSGKDDYITACTAIVTEMKALAPLIDSSFHPELENCIEQVEKAKFIAIKDSPRKAQRTLTKAEKQFTKLSRRFFK